MSSQRESVKVLQECIDLQVRKSQDYQNPNSNIKQAMHYRRGVSSIHDMIAQKLLRAQSLIEPMENGGTREPNFESLEDTYKDLINYASFAVSYIRGKMEGQDQGRDMFNRTIVHEGHGQIEESPFEEITRNLAMGDFEPAFEEVEQEVEQDGFITVVPSLFKLASDEVQNIKLNPGKDASTEEKIKSAYFRDVAKRGEVVKPRGVVNCTDSIQHAYVDRVVHDIGDRIEGDYYEFAKKNSERG